MLSRFSFARIGGRVALLSLGGLLLTGCTSILPAPETPAKIDPVLPDRPTPPAEGEGQIILDTTNGPARVSVLLSTSVMSATSSTGGYAIGMSAQTRPICTTTPCSASLPYGVHTLAFRSKQDPTIGSNEDIEIKQAPIVLRHTMGKVEGSAGLRYGGAMLTGFGLAGVVTGGALLAGDSTTTQTAAKVALGAGAGVFALGVVMLVLGRVKIQPGSSLQWTPEAPAQPGAPRATSLRVKVTPDGAQVAF